MVVELRELKVSIAFEVIGECTVHRCMVFWQLCGSLALFKVQVRCAWFEDGIESSAQLFESLKLTELDVI